MITTYSLLAKEIPTTKQEGEVPGANLSVEVRLGDNPGGGGGATRSDGRGREVSSCREKSVPGGPRVLLPSAPLHSGQAPRAK